MLFQKTQAIKPKTDLFSSPRAELLWQRHDEGIEPAARGDVRSSRPDGTTACADESGRTLDLIQGHFRRGGVTMAMLDLLKAEDIKKALDAFAVADSFDHRKFFELVGMRAMEGDSVNKVFQALDGFSEDGRDLTDAETKRFLDAADKDGDGKIGMDEFQALVHE
ncbi:hypothetical protein CRUP_033320 [Coryphaenoides rupestris]|nr:hypothetical protein CRUP_033320 [Coryphaenoides rupestris]